MKEYTRKLLDKAVDTIEGAELLLEHGKVDMAAGRAYYALFYIAEALLNEKDLQNKTDYIEANPRLWDEDDENPVNGRG